MTIAELKEKNITELTKIARSLDLPGASGMRKQDLIFKILQAQSEKEGHIFAEGVLEIRPTLRIPSLATITTISPAPTIYTFRRRRFANSTSNR
jgi:transcription termination factor Rho